MILAAVGMMLSATPALAEHKLLVTDVLEPKQIEAQAAFEYSHGTANLTDPLVGSGKATMNSFESTYSLGVGLFHGLEVTASLPYVFSERTKVEFGPAAAYEKRDGFGDFALEGKFRLLGGEEKPFTVVAGLGVKFETADKEDGGTGTADVSPFIAASANLGHHLNPYAIYRATIRNHEVQDTHTLTVGVEKKLNENLTVEGKIDANFNTASNELRANEDFAFELTSYVQVAHNFYLLPSVAYLVSTDVTNKATDTKLSSADGVRVGLSLYYLY